MPVVGPMIVRGRRSLVEGVEMQVMELKLCVLLIFYIGG